MKDSVEFFQGRGSYREMQLCSKQPGTPVQVANEAEERIEKQKGYAEKGRREMKWKGQGGVRKEEDKGGRERRIWGRQIDLIPALPALAGAVPATPGVAPAALSWSGPSSCLHTFRMPSASGKDPISTLWYPGTSPV